MDNKKKNIIAISGPSGVGKGYVKSLIINAIEEEESISLSNKTLVHIYRINRKIIQMSEHYKALIKKRNS